MTDRNRRLDEASRVTFDVAIIGGGINGASLHHRLRSLGYDPILLDRGDFASGTSQSSGMMIWGGLLYLRNFDLAAVLQFSRARDRMVRREPESVAPLALRFVPAANGRLGKVPAMAALHLYWLLGRGRRSRPRVRAIYEEAVRLANPGAALCFEEAMLRQSDSRFVLRWLAPGGRDANVAALNYAEVDGGGWSASDRLWRLHVRDVLTGREIEVRTRAVANCAGAWTDRVNGRFGVRSPWRHAFSKGVYLVFERDPEQRAGLVLEMGIENDVVTSIPWGPVELWGPTETAVPEPEEGLQATPEDVSFLLDLRARRLRIAESKDAIVAMRCGVRPLAVPASHSGAKYPLDISRRPRIVADDDRPWVSVYGGKLTGCAEAAGLSARVLRRFLAAPNAERLRGRGGSVAGGAGGGCLAERSGTGATDSPRNGVSARNSTAERAAPPFPTELEEGIAPPAWCRDHEFACTLEDYLRRRTNVAQWIPRGGLGRHDEHLERLRAFAIELAGDDAATGERDLDRHRCRIEDGFDRVLARV